MKEFFISSDGIRLHAKLDRPDDNVNGPLCILVHGFTGHMEEDHIITVQKAMNDAGISVLRAEMYGHGKSDGEFKNHTLYKWVTNALAVVNYAKEYDFVTDLYMCGHSQGGLLTMLVGAMCSDDIKGIIPLSPAWMIPENARDGIILGNKFDQEHIPSKIISENWEISGDYIRTAQTIHVEDSIARFKGKVRIVHGDEDPIVPFSYAKKAVGLYNDAELIPIHGADHCFIGHFDELSDAVSSFFKN